MSEFGDKFRKERELQRVSLDDIAKATKISSRMLRAIEDEQFDRLPGGVFNKGFIRAYAKHLGLNEEEAVNDYLACLRRAQLDSDGVTEAPGRASIRPSATPIGSRMKSPPAEELPDLQLPRPEHVRRHRRDYPDLRDNAIPWRILALALLVIVLGGLLLHRHWRSAHTAPANSTPPAISPTQPAAPYSNPSAPPVANAPSKPPVSSPSPASVRPSSPRAPVSNSRPAILASPTPPHPTAATIQKSANVNEENAPTSAAVAPAETQAALSLVIRASENSWISVTADGRPIVHELLIAPARTTVHAAREITLKVGNAGGVTFLWNGQELPAQGAEAEVVTLVFDSTGMRVLPATPAPPHNP